MLANENWTMQKQKQKRRRVIVQVGILLIIAFFSINALLTLKTYKPYAEQNVAMSSTLDTGFVALSYFGVARKSEQPLIGIDRLHEHLKALKDQGYVTITQADILAYYQSGKPLPAKALFLMFEDGRRDTAIFSQKILEELNFKGTMLTYPENFKKKDPKFLVPDDLIDLEKTTFWEMGTNGYRLAFINVFDRYDNYLGELDPLKHAKVAPYLSRKYNHYLMDYIRDEYGVPKESYARMRERISYDYEILEDIYEKQLGYVPRLYILMHSNTGSFGNNDRVSAVNEYWINKLFTMNFNREGYSFNKQGSSLYDLTRMQPQAYWHTNHLLMRIKYDINQNVEFVQGDADKHRNWETIKGAAEMMDETIVLTSLPQDRGLLRLKNDKTFRNVSLSVNLKGNRLGMQKIYLRADKDLTHYVAVAIFNNSLYVTEKTGGAEQELYKLDLDSHDGKIPVSIPQDKKAAEMKALEVFARYAPSASQAKIYTERLQEKSGEDAPTVDEGADQYVPVISPHQKGNRNVNLTLKGKDLRVVIDEKEAAAVKVSALNTGLVYLETAWGGWGFSQRNLADDVYDGVFEQLVIMENTGAEQEAVVFDSRRKGFDGMIFKAKQYWNIVLDWFMPRTPFDEQDK
ncbi:MULTISPECIES: glycoside hydrolase [Sporomusa]|uniref:glycoside hydrolase n=1 Tax=Sporomusa TaxID=2375 RepID=UPI00166E7582|nr:MULTISPECIES: glycoside hydrolase [Sporomusa]HML35760.1 glycoside hydrolase [Sporomusa sphaeroides]